MSVERDVTYKVYPRTVGELIRALEDIATIANVLSERTLTKDEVYFKDYVSLILVGKTFMDGDRVYDVNIVTGVNAREPTP